VAGVVAALITDYDVRVPPPPVDERALPLVSQLGADDGECHTTRWFRARGKTDYGPASRIHHEGALDAWRTRVAIVVRAGTLAFGDGAA